MMTQNPKAPITEPTITTVISSDEFVDSEMMSEGFADVEVSEVDPSEVTPIVIDGVVADEVAVVDASVDVPVVEVDVFATTPVVEEDGGSVSHFKHCHSCVLLYLRPTTFARGIAR